MADKGWRMMMVVTVEGWAVIADGMVDGGRLGLWRRLVSHVPCCVVKKNVCWFDFFWCLSGEIFAIIYNVWYSHSQVWLHFFELPTPCWLRIPPSAGAFRSAKTAPTTQTADSNKLLVAADPPLAQ
jgi:hypothetical protein